MNDTTTLSPTDPRTTFAHAASTARTVVDGVHAEHLSLPTPCPELDVRSLLGHMVTVFNRLTALGNGTDPMDMPDFVTGVADDAWPDEFLAAAHRVQAAWTDPTKLEQMMVLPWATAPGAAMVHMYTSELTVHTWDLAVATGQSVPWHEPTVEDALRHRPEGAAPRRPRGLLRRDGPRPEVLARARGTPPVPQRGRGRRAGADHRPPHRLVRPSALDGRVAVLHVAYMVHGVVHHVPGEVSIVNAAPSLR